jgi:hypothetical protein
MQLKPQPPRQPSRRLCPFPSRARFEVHLRGIGYSHPVRGVVVILAVAALVGCDRTPTAPAPPPASTQPGRERVSVRFLAPLAPARTTHLARSGEGTIWWVQETESGDDVVFAMGADGVPRATALTSARVLEALELTQAANPRGNFHSLAADRDGRVWFYFAGRAGRRPVACVGRFDPRDGAVRIVISLQQVQEATGMGASLVLARGTVLALGRGEELWLWVRHSDGSRMLRVDAATGTFWSAFEEVTTESARLLSMTRPNLAPGAAADGLLLIDPGNVELWRIDAAGRAKSLHALVGLPTVLSTPTADAKGRAIFVAADAPLIPARTEEEAAQILPVRYPAVLIVESGKLRAIGRDRIDVPQGLALESMRIQQLLAEPEAETLIGYDEHSGALVRLKITAEQ